jgi:hypothetical protein
MFKGGPAAASIELVYLTGILPIKRDRSESALNNFDGLKDSILQCNSGYELDTCAGGVQGIGCAYMRNREAKKYLTREKRFAIV